MISKFEYTLLIVLFGITLIASAIRTSNAVIERTVYDRLSGEVDVLDSATGPVDKISFSGCNPCTPKLFEQIIPIQSLLLFAAFGLFLIRRFSGVILSCLVLLLLVYGYYDWSRETSLIYLGTELSFPYSYQSYLLFNSTKIDIFVLLCTFSLFVLQLGLLVRFAAEKLHARLTPSDKTSST